jgi:hypothetical protein
MKHRLSVVLGFLSLDHVSQTIYAVKKIGGHYRMKPAS